MDKSKDFGSDQLDANADPAFLRLQSTWVLHYQAPRRTGRNVTVQSWEQSVQQVATVDTVAKFWQLFNHLAPPSELANKSTLHLFKEGLEPSWEKNPTGGVWTVTLPEGGKRLNDAWLGIVLKVVGDVFPEVDEILGVSVYIRHTSRVEIWTKDASNARAVKAIGMAAKDACAMITETIEYQSFSNLIRGGGGPAVLTL